jgi:Zn-dependent oligopeptidase
MQMQINLFRGARAQNASAPTTIDGPAAWILCRLVGSGGDVVTLDGARLMFHEIGHALAHLLAEQRIPGISGLDERAAQILRVAGL